MSERENGGQAFPYGDPTHGGAEGMTLRDYFAAAALQGMLANREVQIPEPEQQRERDELGICAYWIADALLAARSK